MEPEILFRNHQQEIVENITAQNIFNNQKRVIAHRKIYKNCHTTKDNRYIV